MGFLREINARVQTPVDGVPGVKENIGLRYKVLKLIDGSVEDLVDVLYVANKGQNPRLTVQALEAYVEDEVEDVDALFDEVLGFLEMSNCTRRETVGARKMAETMMKNQEGALCPACFHG